MGTRFHDMDFELPKGTTIERYWDGTARKFYVPAGTHTKREEPFLPSGRFYRVTETMLDGNWVKYDPNYRRGEPYLARVPEGEGYNKDVAGGRTLGQAWGRIEYHPNLRELPDALVPGSTLVVASNAPHLRPPTPDAAGQATFDFRCPYVLVDGSLSGELSGGAADGLKLEFRVLRVKPDNDTEPDAWSEWDEIHRGPGSFEVPVGRERFNGKDASLHGAYRFQVRVTVGSNPGRTAAAGLSRIRFTGHFEQGIMSIPQIFAGRNTIHFKVRDAAALRGQVRVVYRYQTASGEKEHTRTLRPAEFRDDVASYSFDAPGLLRCRSLSVAY